MTITGIEEWHKDKYLIYLNDEASFALYDKEIKKYGLCEGKELPSDVYQDILDNILIKRAKSRTLHLLDRHDKTEKELREKLRENMYPAEAVEAAVEAAKKGRFLDDRRYAYQYAYEKSAKKSRRAIEVELSAKGVPREMIEDAMAEVYSGIDNPASEIDREETLILKLIKKRCPNLSEADREAEQKLYRYLTGKGFEYDKVKKIFDRYLQEYKDMV